jgi:ketosteroid isomerase-like protein
MKAWMAFPAAALALAACEGPKDSGSGAGTADPAAAEQAVRQADAALHKAYASRNAGSVSAFYLDNATMMTPGEAPATGLGGITKALSEQFMDPGFAVTFKPAVVDVASSGDLGYVQGSFQARHTDWKANKVVAESGSYLTIYRRQPDGSWKIVQDIATPGK